MDPDPGAIHGIVVSPRAGTIAPLTEDSTAPRLHRPKITGLSPGLNSMEEEEERSLMNRS